MTNRSYSYTRLAKSDEILSERDQRYLLGNNCFGAQPVNLFSRVSENGDTFSGTKLRRFQVGQLKERWPGSASHLPTLSSSDYLEHIIKPKETLQGIALAYRCSVTGKIFDKMKSVKLNTFVLGV